MTLSDLLAALPDDALVPVGWVRSQLAGGLDGPDDESAPPTGVASDPLTVDQVAARLDRAPSTVRSWCAAGRFDGAFRLRGREWRIPSQALGAFLLAEASGADASAGAEDVARIDAWRAHLRRP